MKKISFVLYALLLILSITLLVTEYSFTKIFFDLWLIFVLLGFPLYQLFRFIRSKGLRVLLFLFVLGLASFMGYKFLIFRAFFDPDNRQKVEKWTHGNFEVELTYGQEWTGPRYYNYQLKKKQVFGVFEKNLASNYAGSQPESKCLIPMYQFMETGEITYMFNRCENTLCEIE